MQGILIDTDIAIDYLRGNRYAKDLMFSLWDSNTGYLSILSVYELYAGMKDNEIEATDDFTSACIIEPVTLEIAKKGGELYRHYREKGLTLTSIDCLIMSTALLKGHKIATNNIKHYPDKKLLSKV